MQTNHCIRFELIQRVWIERSILNKIFGIELQN